MLSETIRKDSKIKFRQLEWLIITMAGTTLGSLQVIRYAFLSTGGQLTVFQTILDWLFAMTIIVGLVHFSFREICKIQDELIERREQADKAEKRIKHIIDTTQDAIFTLDNEGYFTFASRSIETLTGYSLNNILTMNIRAILTNEYSSFIYKQLKESTDLAGRHLYVDVLQDPGSIIPIEISFVPIKDHWGQLSGFQGIARDITERKEVEKAHQEKERYLQSMAKVGQLIIEDANEIPYKTILEVLCKATDSQRAFVVLNDVNSSSMLGAYNKSDSRFENDMSQEHSNVTPRIVIYDMSNGNGSKLTTSSSPAVAENYLIVKAMKTNELAVGSPDENIAKLVIPILVEGKSVGTIGLNRNSSSGNWKSVHITLLSTVVNMLSQAIERQSSNAQLKRHFISLARTLSKAFFVMDPYTASHQQRLAAMVCKVGEKIGLNPKKIEWLYFCGLLHDIGKAAIPGSILSKPGILTDEEWVLMRSHVKRGCEILQSMHLPDDVVEIVLHHHERLDGSGYPEHATGEKISMGARILAVCDVVEAMISHRPYRPARTKEEIREEMNKGKGQKYDPKIVDLVMDMIESPNFNDSWSQRENELAAVKC